MAQRYTDAYSGILAAAPAINWQKFVVGVYWPQFVMNQIGYYPCACEMSGITDAAISACDELDGVEDGIVAAPGLCKFNASDAVGKEVSCGDGTTMKVSDGAAKIARATWAVHSHRTENRFGTASTMERLSVDRLLQLVPAATAVTVPVLPHCCLGLYQTLCAEEREFRHCRYHSTRMRPDLLFFSSAVRLFRLCYRC
jgi:hypothetical protein